MKLTRHMIRFWLTMAMTAASLMLASSASAMNVIDTGGPSATPQVPVTFTNGGFNWADAALGAAVAVALTLAAIAVAYGARNRSRLAPSH